MNTANTLPSELAADRFARRVTARLTSSTDDLPYDISERLRAARMQALAKRKVVVPVHRAAPAVMHSGSTAVLGGGNERGVLLSALFFFVFVMAMQVGLVVINAAQDEQGNNEVAEVDAALLTDELPPAAYSDPGFVQFLKTTHTSN